MGNKFSKIKKYLKQKNRFILQNPSSFEQKFTLTISKSNTILLVSALVLLFAFIVYLVISFTSLKNYIPGYPSKGSELYQIDKENQSIIAEMYTENRNRELWIKNLQSILNESDSLRLKDIKDTLSKDSSFNYKDVIFQRVKEDSILRKKNVELTRKNNFPMLLTIPKDIHSFEFPSDDVFKSIEKNKIFSAVFSSKYKSKVRVTMDGTIVSSASQSIVIQHSNNVISAFDNINEIKNSPGDRVKKGESIGVVSDSDYYFQLWYQGNSVPADILNELRK